MKMSFWGWLGLLVLIMVVGGIIYNILIAKDALRLYQDAMNKDFELEKAGQSSKQTEMTAVEKAYSGYFTK